MIHYLLDANALLRFLRKDIPKQAELVAALFIQAKQSTVLVTIPLAAILETVYVLSKVYREPKEAIGSKLFDITSSPMLEIESRETVKQALLIWKNTTVSFVDCLVLAKALAEGKRLFTFDQKLKRLMEKMEKDGY